MWLNFIHNVWTYTEEQISLEYLCLVSTHLQPTSETSLWCLSLYRSTLDNVQEMLALQQTELHHLMYHSENNLASARGSKSTELITSTGLWNEHPDKSLFMWKKNGMLVYMYVSYLLRIIDCGYTLRIILKEQPKFVCDRNTKNFHLETYFQSHESILLCIPNVAS